jgi:very-short-patch-repair endonuclease
MGKRDSPPGTGGVARRAGVVDQVLSSHLMKPYIHNSTTLEPNRKELRNALTSAEAFLWDRLKKKQLSGKKFRRQYSVGPYIVDFFCPEARLAVELDGAHHFTVIGQELDAKRDLYLKEKGIVVLRFENREVFENLEFVLEVIRKNFERT